MSDCTAEGLKGVMLLQESCDFLQQNVSGERLCQAVDVVSLNSLSKYITNIRRFRNKCDIVEEPKNGGHFQSLTAHDPFQ